METNPQGFAWETPEFTSLLLVCIHHVIIHVMIMRYMIKSLLLISENILSVQDRIIQIAGLVISQMDRVCACNMQSITIENKRSDL